MKTSCLPNHSTSSRCRIGKKRTNKQTNKQPNKQTNKNKTKNKNKTNKQKTLNVKTLANEFCRTIAS